MADLLIRNLKPETLAYWEERARRNGRSLDDEISERLDATEGETAPISGEDSGGRAGRLRELLLERRGGVPFASSATLIRKDRDTDHGREPLPVWERARRLRAQILERRGGMPLPDAASIIREDRDYDHGRLGFASEEDCEADS